MNKVVDFPHDNDLVMMRRILGCPSLHRASEILIAYDWVMENGTEADRLWARRKVREWMLSRHGRGALESPRQQAPLPLTLFLLFLIGVGAVTVLYGIGLAFFVVFSL